MNLPDPLQIDLVRQGGTRLGLVDIQGQARRSLFEVLAQGRDEGLGPPDLARRIRDQLPAGRFRTSAIRARAIARTETKWAQNRPSIAVYRRGGNWRATRVTDAQLGDTDEPCQRANGQVWTFAGRRQPVATSQLYPFLPAQHRRGSGHPAGCKMNQPAPDHSPTITDEGPRCWRCGRMLARQVSRPWAIVCQRCKAENQSG